MANSKFGDLTGGQKVAYIGVLIVLLALFGPVLGMAALAAKSAAVAIGYAALIAVGILVWNPFTRILKTWLLKAMKANARLNPIETLQLDYQKKKEDLDRFVAFVTKMIADQKVSQDALDDLKKRFPDRDLSSRQELMDKMKAAVGVLRTKAEAADGQLSKYKEEIDFMAADNAWAQRASGAMARMKSIDGGAALDEILKGEAIGQVRQNVAQAFAELDMLLQQDGAKDAIAFANSDSDDPQMIEGHAVEIPQFFSSSGAKVPA